MERPRPVLSLSLILSLANCNAESTACSSDPDCRNGVCVGGRCVESADADGDADGDSFGGFGDGDDGEPGDSATDGGDNLSSGDPQTSGDRAPGDGDSSVGDAAPGCPPPTMSGQVVDWATVFGVAWPGPTYANVNDTIIPTSGYLAIRFATGSVVDDGTVYTIENTTVSGVRFGSISACAGEIHSDLPSECTHAWGIGGSIRWSTASQPVAGACALAPDTTYYFNITFVNSSDEDTCVILYGSNCTTTVSASNQ